MNDQLHHKSYSRPTHIPPSYLEEAADALSRLSELCANLSANGFETNDEWKRDPNRLPAVEEVATSLAYLDLSGVRIKSRSSMGDATSYGWKHRAEEWGRVAGFAPYVSNGAFITALLVRKVPIRTSPWSGPNCTPALTNAWHGLRGDGRSLA